MSSGVMGKYAKNFKQELNRITTKPPSVLRFDNIRKHATINMKWSFFSDGVYQVTKHPQAELSLLAFCEDQN